MLPSNNSISPKFEIASPGIRHRRSPRSPPPADIADGDHMMRFVSAVADSLQDGDRGDPRGGVHGTVRDHEVCIAIPIEIGDRHRGWSRSRREVGRGAAKRQLCVGLCACDEDERGAHGRGRGRAAEPADQGSGVHEVRSAHPKTAACAPCVGARFSRELTCRHCVGGAQGSAHLGSAPRGAVRRSHARGGEGRQWGLR